MTLPNRESWRIAQWTEPARCYYYSIYVIIISSMEIRQFFICLHRAVVLSVELPFHRQERQIG